VQNSISGIQSTLYARVAAVKFGYRLHRFALQLSITIAMCGWPGHCLIRQW